MRSYYITYSAVVQSLFGYLGVVLFQTCMRRWTFRSVLASTVLLQVMAGAVDLVIVLRWNVLVGIPDEVMYMLGYNGTRATHPDRTPASRIARPHPSRARARCTPTRFRRRRRRRTNPPPPIPPPPPYPAPPPPRVCAQLSTRSHRCSTSCPA